MFILLIIYLTVLIVVFCFCISVFRKKHKVKGISHGKNLSLSQLTLPQPGIQNDWFWDEVNGFDLTHLLSIGYDNISHGFVCALSER